MPPRTLQLSAVVDQSHLAWRLDASREGAAPGGLSKVVNNRTAPEAQQLREQAKPVIAAIASALVAATALGAHGVGISTCQFGERKI